MARTFILAFGIGAIALSTAGCNTVKGLGRDIESLGEAGDKVVSAPVRSADTLA
jgi:predicted small secreted protein